jgi:sulfite exporter TauE/SafE
VTIGLVIVALALWLLLRWKRGAFAHDHTHLSVPPARPPWQAYGIGLVHGIGGSGGVGVLLLAAIGSQTVALVALVLFAAGTAVSMAVLSGVYGSALGRERVRARFDRLAPALGAVSLAFGVWYTLGALSLAPYVL